jgi:hypothetical protein
MAQFTKNDTVAKPTFDHVKYGEVVNRIGADKSNGNAGGEVRPSDYIGKSHSVHPTRGLGGDVPKRTNQ